MSNVKNGFDRVASDIVGDHVKKGAGHDWLRAGALADLSILYAVIMLSMRMGEALWRDSKLAEVIADYAIRAGVPDGVRSGWNTYSSVLLIDPDGLVCTFTSSSWGGKTALTDLIPQYCLRGQKSFPVVQLSSKARGNMYGTIDPVFKVTGWVPAEKFAAITGDMTEALALEAPVEPTPHKRTISEIIDDDDIPFAWAAVLPFAMLIAGTMVAIS